MRLNTIYNIAEALLFTAVSGNTTANIPKNSTQFTPFQWSATVNIESIIVEPSDIVDIVESGDSILDDGRDPPKLVDHCWVP